MGDRNNGHCSFSSDSRFFYPSDDWFIQMTFDELPINDRFQFKWGWPEILTKSGPFTYLNNKGQERRTWLLERSVLPLTNYEKTETISEPKKGSPGHVARLSIRDLKLSSPLRHMKKIDLAGVASEIWFWCAFAGATVILILEFLGMRGL